MYTRPANMKHVPTPRPGDVAGYEPRRPVCMSWSVAHPEQFAVICWQTSGNEARVIGSMRWDFPALHECFTSAKETFPWKLGTTHLVGSDIAPETLDLFYDAELDVEAVPKMDYAATVHVSRELFPVLSIDCKSRSWVAERENNFELVEALNSYGATESTTDTYTRTPEHSWAVYYVRAFELFATWFHMGGFMERVQIKYHRNIKRSLHGT